MAKLELPVDPVPALSAAGQADSENARNGAPTTRLRHPPPQNVNSGLSGLLPRSEAHRATFLVFVIAAVGSCISPPYTEHLMLQHTPTVLAAVALVVLERRVGISYASFLAIIAFLLLHSLGARYLYSYVPYDEWATAIVGVDITKSFGWSRNHYDRLVHFLYGVLFTAPARGASARFVTPSRTWGALLAVQFILATSALYELGEWLLATTMAPEWADQYNGQQGDPWDAHVDMALALVGSILCAGGMLAAEYRRSLARIVGERLP